ncbi:chromosomal replication initiation protein DnaA [candidate division WOR-1 bacterium RIFOXYB2_FULL_42_35]|uniref:Chromosomal replication initiator protein DnaA n=1 Tax=candidate division WOR-1 bacterium RIFOXYC2_FULL_41_25 TaxID=1802586 RepID=A0A1F4TJ91_UNCSA|nr:MAG: chromosomal replication initiation protein DnaA [candidate division WOR-1 bacterium RIFOXYA2_FULL_41_14]OGC21959.1 MAG: chromosomal replication initiation protein DnaA [candidate division WOR-1 bacterium RIFOXYB2_FULL_42_35]OGC32792.1 MAG: chromosomal replication initiation protein DnaA [candidate division WOR-1 bacterium RIFOXYC2_FULL_41_25]
MNSEYNINALWAQVVPTLEKSLNKPIFEALVSSTKPLSISNLALEIAVPNQLVKDWLSKHCVTLLEQEVRSIYPEIKRVVFFVGDKDLFNTPPLEISSERDIKETKSPGPACLNPRYTFDTFVVGHGNRFAHAAALAVAEAPAKAYNPLFLYGGVGLGKTHLMQAIGHHVASSKQRARTLYITSETFTNDLISSIRDDKTLYFRNKYRNIDILMVDDIQFLAGKERTQEEFFHTFNALYEAGKQVVVSSDRPPKEIPTLEERLRSRFEWGLIADVQPPDLETRIAILQKKAELSELALPDEIYSYIASKIVSNIRELEGALIRVVAFASLNASDINIQLVDQALKDLYAHGQNKSGLTISTIKKVAAQFYNVRIDDFSAKIRTKEIATARQVAMYLCRELTGASLPKIGGEFGGRDHTTVMHACDKIRSGIKNNTAVREVVTQLTNRLKSYTP